MWCSFKTGFVSPSVFANFLPNLPLLTVMIIEIDNSETYNYNYNYTYDKVIQNMLVINISMFCTIYLLFALFFSLLFHWNIAETIYRDCASFTELFLLWNGIKVQARLSLFRRQHTTGWCRESCLAKSNDVTGEGENIFSILF